MSSSPSSFLSDLVDPLPLKRHGRFHGSVALPGSKSIANRALLLAGLARGTTRLLNVPDADDVEILVRTLPRLGAPSEVRAADASADPGGGENFPGRVVTVTGRAGPFPVKEAELMLGNAGTALRPLTAILAASSGDFVIDGDQHMRKRPIGDLIGGLRAVGVEISGSGPGAGYPPLRLRARGLRPGTVSLSGKVSSQYISALLMTAPLAGGANGGARDGANQEAFVVEVSDEPVSKPYIDLTITMMRQFGVAVEREGYRRFRVPPGQVYQSPGDYYIEGDASAATYFLAAGILPGSGPVRVTGLGRSTLQGDVGFADLLEELGGKVEFGPDWIECSAGQGELIAPDLDMNAMPDAAMTLAVLALFLKGTTHIRNIANLRVKESERIAGLRKELEKLGARVEEEHDALHITPPADGLRPARIATYHDHRMAMAFSLASFGTALEIENPGCVSKTYPDYFKDFEKICL